MECQGQSSSGSEASVDSNIAGSSDQATTSDLNKRLESSLNANKVSESKSVEEPLKGQCSASSSTDIKKNIAEILSEISILNEIESSCHESSLRKVQTTKCMKLAENQPSFSGSETSRNLNTAEKTNEATTSLQNICDLNKRFESSLNINKKPESNFEKDKPKVQDSTSQPSSIRKCETELLSKKPNLKDTKSKFDESSASMVQNPKCMESANVDPVSKNLDNPKLDVRSEKRVSFSRQRETVLDANAKSFHPGYPRNVNPAHFLQNIRPGVQNQASANSERSFSDSKDRHHYQHQTFHSPLYQNKTYMNQFNLPYSREMQSHQRQVRPRMLARPVRLPPRCTGTSYHNPFPPIRTDAKPARQVGGCSNPNPIPPIRTNATPARFFKKSTRFENPMSAFRNNAPSMQPFQQLIPNNTEGSRFSQDLTRSTTDSSANQLQLSTAKNQPNLISNLEQSGKVTTLEELAKRAHYSKKNMLSIEIPSKSTPEPYLPINAISQGVIPPMQSQQIPIQFPTPACSGYFGANFSGVRRIVPNLQHQSAGYNDPSNIYSYFHPGVLHQYQPVTQNLTETPQYQHPNIPMYQYVTQNIRAYSQCNDPNYPIRQFLTQNQPPMQNQQSVLQYQDPNRIVHQYGTQYLDPNIMYHVGANTSSHNFNSIDTRSRPTYVANIPSQNFNPNLLPMQTFATNPTFTGAISNPICSYGSEQSYYFNDAHPNMSALQAFVENPSSTGASLNPLGFYSINEPTNNSWISDPNQHSNYYQDHVPISNPDLIQANVYNSWSVSNDDSNENSPVDYPDETSTNQ